MSNSSLVCYRKLSPNCNKPRNHKIDTITIHHMAGNLTIEQCGNVFAPTSRQASSNYGIGTDGRIGMYVEEKNRSWCTSSSSNDNRAITIEVANDGGDPDWHVSDKAMTALINLCVDICRRNGISKINYTGDKSGNLTMHQWFAPTGCPGPYLKSKFPWIASEVNKRLKDGTPISPSSIVTVPDSDLDYDPESGGLTIESIDYTKLNPYIITVDRNTRSVDYSIMKTKGVAGVMIEAGCLYDSIHREQRFESPKAEEQAKSAASSDLPHAFYMTCKARSIAEAEREMYEFSFLIRKYPPMFGVWLRLNLVKSVSINDAILDKYYAELVRLGLKASVGIYVTESQLKQITWSKHQDNWYLWIDKHVSNTSELDQLMTPDFFDM